MSLANSLVVGSRRRANPRMARRAPAPAKQAARNAAPAARVPQVARGVLWAALLIAACSIGSLAVAVVMVPAALIASMSAVRAMPRPRSGARLFVAVAGPAAAALSFILAAAQGANLALTLAFLVCLYDAACYLNGNGRGTGGLLGVGGGLLTVAVLALFVAAVLVPPFTGAKPWEVVGFTGLAAPVGVWLAGRVPGWERLPALRRIDSLILAGPVWVILVATLVQR